MLKREHSVLQHLQTIFESGTVGDLTDRQLLERFGGRDPEMAELCFATLVERHGPMVLRTCQSILQNRHDAEDAFQATFLVLSRKARSLWIRDSLGPWLFQVARRVAGSARSEGLRRLNREREAAKMTGSSAIDGTTWDDQGAVVCEELGRLPDRYRAAVVLCDLEGLTQERAAQLLGLPAGTVRSRLARARERLRERLTRRGLAPTPSAGLPWLTGNAAAPAVPAALVSNTTRAAVDVITHHAALGSMGSIGALTEGVLSIMFWNKVKQVSGVMIAAGLLGGTALLASWPAGEQDARLPVQKADDATKKPAEGKTDRAVPGTRDGGSSQGVSRNGTARLHVAKKLRDEAYELFVGNPKRPFTEFLLWQNRYYDVVGDVLVNTDADRVKFLEHRLAIFTRLESFIREMMKGENKFQGMDLDAVELDRLEIEDRLEKSRATLRASGDKPAGTVSSELMKFLNDDSWTPEGAAISRP
jgi:RNA polymerase sigma factor (sigma-70 family)